MFRGERVSGRLRKMVLVRVHPKSCILAVSTCVHSDLSDSHFGSTSVDTVFPNQVVPISVDDIISCVRSIKHLGRVEYERPINRIDARVRRHPVLSVSWLMTVSAIQDLPPEPSTDPTA